MLPSNQPKERSRKRRADGEKEKGGCDKTPSIHSGDGLRTLRRTTTPACGFIFAHIWHKVRTSKGAEKECESEIKEGKE